MSLKFSSTLAWRVLLALYPSVVPLYDFFLFFSPLEYTAKLLCYHLVNYTPTGKLNWVACRIERIVQHNCLRNKVDNFCVADESQCPVKATFSGLGHFPTVFQST